MTRLVTHRILNGVIEVCTYARSIPEAVALESACKSVPPAEAYSYGDDCADTGEGYTPPDPPPVQGFVERREDPGELPPAPAGPLEHAP